MVAKETIRICALIVAIAAGFALIDKGERRPGTGMAQDTPAPRVHHVDQNSEWAASPRPAIMIIRKVRTMPAWRAGMI